MSSKLLNSTRFAKNFNESLVHEFYENLDESTFEVESSFYGVVFVRNEVVDFIVE